MKNLDLWLSTKSEPSGTTPTFLKDDSPEEMSHKAYASQLAILPTTPQYSILACLTHPGSLPQALGLHLHV